MVMFMGPDSSSCFQASFTTIVVFRGGGVCSHVFMLYRRRESNDLLFHSNPLC